MKYIKLTVFVLFLAIMLCNCTKAPTVKIDDIDYYSDVLQKEMQLKVYTPSDYNDNTQYPVLYFFPDYGGSVYTVMEEYDIAVKAEKLITNNEIYPLIIVAVDIDRSFGVNSTEKVETVITASDKSFQKGMYEDYFCKEIIPYIDEQYNTIPNKQGRYIGGYSMGGFSALHIALRNSELFSKVGGHSPSIFVNDFPDKTVTEFLYPTDEAREQLDPIHIVQNNELDNLSVFLDVEVGGSDGVKYLYDILAEKNINVEYHILSYSHSRSSCNQNMETYLLFYAGQ